LAISILMAWTSVALVRAEPSVPCAIRTTTQDEPNYFARAGREIRTKHYRVLSDLGGDLTELYCAHLELMYDEYARRLSGLAQQAPEVPFVLMFAHERDYLDVLRDRYGMNANGSGGMFFTTPAGSALAFFTGDHPRMRVFHVMQHEGFHQYANSRFANTLPMWVNEGLAEFFGEAVVIGDRVIVGQSSSAPVEAVRRAIEQGSTIGFKRMLGMSSDEWSANVRDGNATIQYQQAWSMVQFLGWAENGRYQAGFEQYLRALHAGTPSEQAFVQAFGADEVDKFEKAWTTWALAAQPSALSVAASRITYLAEGMRVLSREGVRSETLDDLLAQLSERKFTTTVTVHGRTQTMEATPQVITIPKDGLAAAQPVFELMPAPRAKGSSAQRALDELHPTPSVITTRGLEPRELVLKWKRSKSGDDFEYELLSPREAPKTPKYKRIPATNPTANPPTPSGNLLDQP
jgi:hypothetical protein